MVQTSHSYQNYFLTFIANYLTDYTYLANLMIVNAKYKRAIQTNLLGTDRIFYFYKKEHKYSRINKIYKYIIYKYF